VASFLSSLLCLCPFPVLPVAFSFPGYFPEERARDAGKYVGIPAAEAADYIVRDAVSELVYRGIANTPALAAGVYTTLKSIIGSKTRALKNGK
jgi:hypothetical protein